MALSNTEEKYINLTLADLLEQVLYYKTKIDVTTGGARDRAIWRALYIHSIKMYNRALGTLGLVGTSNLARLQKPISDKMLREEGLDYITEADIANIVSLAYGVSKIERQAQRYEMKKKMAQAFTVGINLNGPVQKALETLVKHGAIDKLIPLDKLIESTARPIELPNVPRGNPRKGGLVSGFLNKGYSIEEAHRAADKQIYEEAAGATIYEEDKIQKQSTDDIELAKAIEESYKTMPKTDKNNERAIKDLAMLMEEEDDPFADNNIPSQPAESTDQPKAKTQSLSDLNPLEEGGFK